MPGLVISIGGKLDSSYSNALQKAAILARQEQRKMETIREIAPNQLAIVKRALATLPQESLMRPKLMAMQEALTATMAGAGGSAASGFMGKFLGKLQNLGGSGTSQLISVFSNTLSSLGAGISPARIFAQQAPNFIQAFTLMGKNAMSMLSKILFNPATWVAGGAIAAGGLFYYISYRAKKAAEDIASIGASFSHSLGPMERMVSLLEQASKKSKEIADSNREFNKWLQESENKMQPAKTAAEAALKREAAKREAIEQQAKLVEAMEKSKTASQGYSEAAADAKRYDEAIKASQARIDAYNKELALQKEISAQAQYDESGRQIMAGGSGKSNLAAPLIEIDGKKVPMDQLQNMLNQSIQKTKFNESEKSRQEAIVADLKANVSEAQKKADFYGNQTKQLDSRGAPARMVTERERIGLGASSSIQTSMLEQLKKQNTTQNAQLTALQKMVTQLEEGL